MGVPLPPIKPKTPMSMFDRLLSAITPQPAPPVAEQIAEDEQTAALVKGYYRQMKQEQLEAEAAQKALNAQMRAAVNQQTKEARTKHNVRVIQDFTRDMKLGVRPPVAPADFHSDVYPYVDKDGSVWSQPQHIPAAPSRISVYSGSAPPPGKPAQGDHWMDLSTNTLRTWDGQRWRDLSVLGGGSLTGPVQGRSMAHSLTDGLVDLMTGVAPLQITPGEAIGWMFIYLEAVSFAMRQGHVGKMSRLRLVIGTHDVLEGYDREDVMTTLVEAETMCGRNWDRMCSKAADQMRKYAGHPTARNVTEDAITAWMPGDEPNEQEGQAVRWLRGLIYKC